MRKYEMDLANIVEDMILSTDGQTGGRPERWIKYTQYTPINFVEAGYD